MHVLRDRIPPVILDAYLSQYGCEIEPDCLCFEEPYQAAAACVPKDYAIVDCGCYMAPQAYLFEAYPVYLGIDCYEASPTVRNLRRFETRNSIMLEGKIQDLVGRILNPGKCYALCIGVPDESAWDAVRKRFPNHLIWYPARPTEATGVGKEAILSCLHQLFKKERANP